MRVLNPCRVAHHSEVGRLPFTTNRPDGWLTALNVVVEVDPPGGEAVRGTIKSITDQDFVLSPGGSVGDRHFAYDQAQGLSLEKLSYKAAGQPDPVQARRVVAGFGGGKAVRITLVDEKKLKGKIPTLDMERFSLLPNSQSDPVKIAYTDVQQVGTGGMAKRIQWLILAGAVGAMIVVIAVLVSRTSG